jgi:hypothetical protein
MQAKTTSKRVVVELLDYGDATAGRRTSVSPYPGVRA